MAGFFGLGNYSKPGPGVSKDEPQKHSFFLFFEIYFRKFWKLCEINMLYFVFCVPFFIPFFLALFFKSNTVAVTLSLVPLIGISVITSGLTFILRNFARQEHAFLWMDFIDTIKSNWRQSLAVGAIDFVIYFLMINSIYFYNSRLSSSMWFVLPLAFCIVFTTIFTFMQYYLFVLIITFDLTVKQIFKNAFIFSFAGFGHNILITLFCGILVLLIYIFNPLSFILIPFILISTFGFIITFNVWPIIKKYMIPEETAENKVEDETIFLDEGKEKNK